MAFTTYLKNKLLDHLFTDSAFSPPATLYVALSTTEPAVDGTGVTEPTTGAYARATVDASDMDAAAAGEKDNGGSIVFPTATATWGTVTHFGLYDADTSGNLLLFGALSTAREVASGDTPQFKAGAFKVML